MSVLSHPEIGRGNCLEGFTQRSSPRASSTGVASGVVETLKEAHKKNQELFEELESAEEREQERRVKSKTRGAVGTSLSRCLFLPKSRGWTRPYMVEAGGGSAVRAQPNLLHGD